ncbi:hypothetical protein HK099_005880 [Clydaea vesicula]|uniref:Kinesin motor domain-containing protein n=1 Tax=Clydaea vesicula TaxID=447962 RepID=A0AAD5UA12_9FUNG|nr:hypothetical protein HK099_005880 [Clydaea vesicula]KAJ3392311.1 hypothetical protein HDU92_008542 [Lobulomyces angularis]
MGSGGSKSESSSYETLSKSQESNDNFLPEIGEKNISENHPIKKPEANAIKKSPHPTPAYQKSKVEKKKVAPYLPSPTGQQKYQREPHSQPEKPKILPSKIVTTRKIISQNANDTSPPTVQSSSQTLKIAESPTVGNIPLQTSIPLPLTVTNVDISNKKLNRPDNIKYFKFYQGFEECVYENEFGQLYLCDWKNQKLTPLSHNWDKIGHFVHRRGVSPKDRERMEVSPLTINSSVFPVTKEIADEPTSTLFHINSLGKRVFSTLLPVRRYNRLKFEDSTNQWIQMELEEEAEIPFVTNLIDKVQILLPSWKDRIGILQGLRDNGYDIKLLLANNMKMNQIYKNGLNEIANRFLEEDFDSQLKLTNGNAAPINFKEKLYASKELFRKDELIINLKCQLKLMHDQLEERTKLLEEEKLKNITLEEKIASLTNDINSQSENIFQKNEALMSVQNSLVNLNSRCKDLMVEVEILKNGTDRDMYDFKTSILQEKEDHICRLRLQIMTYQHELGVKRSKKRLQKGQMLNLLQRIKRIKFEHERFTQGIKRVLSDLQLSLTFKILIPINDNMMKLEENFEKIVMERQVECLRRKKAWEQSGIVRGNVRVFARCKPAIVFNQNKNSEGVVLKVSSETDISVNLGFGSKIDHNTIKTLPYQFDRAFNAESTQKDVFEEMKYAVKGAIFGLNLGIYAIGQTNSGKSYTLQGTVGNEGLMHLFLKELYFSIEEYERESNYSKVKVFCSAFEVHNENVFDLYRDIETPCWISKAKSGDFQMDPPVQQVRCTTFLQAIQNVERAISSRKQLLTMKKRTTSTSTLIIKFLINSSESELIENVQQNATTGSISFLDVAGIEERYASESEKAHQNADIILEKMSIKHTYKSLEVCLASTYDNHPLEMVVGSNSAVVRIISDCFTENGRNFVIIGLSPYERDTDMTLASCEFGKSICIGQPIY